MVVRLETREAEIPSVSTTKVKKRFDWLDHPLNIFVLPIWLLATCVVLLFHMRKDGIVSIWE